MSPKFIAIQLYAICAACTVPGSNGLHMPTGAEGIRQPNHVSHTEEIFRSRRVHKRQIPIDPSLQQAALASRMVPNVAALQRPDLWGLWKAKIPPIPIIPAEMMPVNHPQPLAMQLPTPPGPKKAPKLPMPTAVDYIMLNVYVTSKLEELELRVLRVESKLEKLEQPPFLSWPDGRTS